MLKLFTTGGRHIFKIQFQVGSVLRRNRKVANSETESLRVMTQRLNPFNGDYEWVEQDEDYDFHQEIARSAFADMLHDYERNDKYYEGIKKAIKQTHQKGMKAHVLDIGTGTGLLAMMAARSGADTIHACEAFSPISKCAVKVIEENGLDDRITVIHKRSTSMTVGDHGDIPHRCNILVTEVFDTELIGEGAIATFNHAHRVLLEKDCIVVPSRATMYAQVVESDWMQRWNKLSPWGDVVPSEDIRNCRGAAAVHDLQLSQVRQQDFTAITTPEPVFRFDWSGRSGQIANDGSSAVITKAVASGTAQMVFMWWSLDMDEAGEVVLSCAPWWAHPDSPSGPEAIPWRDHWMQAVYYLPAPVLIQQGQNVKLLSSHDEFSLWFNVCTIAESSDLPEVFPHGSEEQLARLPVCDCMLHVTCSRTRIGMLNDPVRRDKYLKVLRQLVTPESVVLCVGENSLLGLLAATLGAKMVYHMQENPMSCKVMKRLIEDNNLESVVKLIEGYNPILDDKIASSINLVVGEPYFLKALSPWHILRWFTIKNCYKGAVGMPASISLHMMPMQFDHLHKIRAPLGTISGFQMTSFDLLIRGSGLISDSDTEVHPLWEYPGISLGHPRKIISFDQFQRFYSMDNTIEFNVSGTWHGMALWVDIHLDAETTVSTGPVEPPVPGEPVRWDPYTRQAVYFMVPEVPVTKEDCMQCTIYNDEQVELYDIMFKFSLQPLRLPKTKRNPDDEMEITNGCPVTARKLGKDETCESSGNPLKITNGPPVTARKLGKDETYESFLQDYLNKKENPDDQSKD